MLFESITYRDKLPFELSFLNVAEENKHCHKEIEILFVLRGVTNYQIYHTNYELNPGDLIIADVEDLHQIHGSSADILLLSIHVDTSKFEHLYPNIRYMFFVCEECMDGPSGNKQLLQNKLSLLKQCLAKLTLDYFNAEGDKALLDEGVNNLISILVNHFQGFFMEDYQYKTSQENLNPEDLHRLSRITRYILLNYNQKITLDDVSRMEHLSSYYVSHLIKKTLGFNFQNFVNAIRLEFAEKLLVFSNLTLMQISQECGFSSPNYFNKCFSAWHGKTPAQYRKDYHPCERSYQAPFSQEEALTLLAPYLNCSNALKEQNGEALHQIAVDLDFHSAQFEDFWEQYAPRIMINSMEEVIKLGYFEEKLRQVRPAAFLTDENLSGHNKDVEKGLTDILARFPAPHRTSANLKKPNDLLVAANAADAFTHIFNSSPLNVFFIGRGNALFTPEGLETPLYSAYRFFSEHGKPQIYKSKYYVLIKSDKALCAVLFNTGPHFVLNVHLQTEGLPKRFYLLRTELSESDNCYSALNDLNSPAAVSDLLKDRIRAASAGNTHFSLIGEDENPSLDFLIYHNTVTILELIQPE